MTTRKTAPSRSRKTPAKSRAPALVKRDTGAPALVVTGRTSIAIRAGTVFAGRKFTRETPAINALGEFIPGRDYVVIVPPKGAPSVLIHTGTGSHADVIGGFHFAPGGNATRTNKGGDTKPAINPFSVWDVNFRPACKDPRGMTLIDGPFGKFWCDIYLTGANHADEGTSVFGATIADGGSLPVGVERFNYEAAGIAMAQHGKCLLGAEEFFAAAYGVTERTAAGSDPKVTGLDAPRTSRWGVMQATGNLYVWGHDGHPDTPRASIFGGHWSDGDGAGSRRAYLACPWPGDSYDWVGARGRSDHLQLD